VVTDKVVSTVAVEAEQWLPRPVEELEYRFKLALAEAVVDDRVPHRGDDSFWLDVRSRLKRQILKHSTGAAVTVGMVARDVMEWADSAGLDLEHYRSPLSILVAMVTKAVLDELESRSSDGGDSHRSG
jgi:hypothetical protein